MKRAIVTPALLAAALLAPPSPAAGQDVAAAGVEPPAATEFERIELRPREGAPLPYTLEVPKGWRARQVEGYPGLWLGPEGAEPPEDPRLVWVRGSKVSLAEPEKVVAAIRANDEKQAEWSASRLEVREVGGVRGVLVRMDSGEGESARSTLTLKLPLAGAAADLVVSAPRAEFERRLPLYERILLSVRFVGATS